MFIPLWVVALAVGFVVGAGLMLVLGVLAGRSEKRRVSKLIKDIWDEDEIGEQSEMRNGNT